MLFWVADSHSYASIIIIPQTTKRSTRIGITTPYFYPWIHLTCRVNRVRVAFWIGSLDL